MTVRNIFSNFALHSDMDSASVISSDDIDHQASIMNLSGGTTMAILIPLATVGFGGPISGSWSITAISLKYYDNPNYSGTPITETFDPVTGVSDVGNKLVFADGSPVTFPINGDETATIDVYVLINNPISNGLDKPSTANNHFVAVSFDAGTFSPNTINVNASYLMYRGPASLVTPGKFLTFDGNNQ